VSGDDEPGCDDAVFGRGLELNGSDASCRAPGADGTLHAASGSPATRDKLTTSTAAVVNLAGNVREWAGDYFNEQGEACWAERGVLHDPVCNVPSPSLGVAYRVMGGAWGDTPAYMRAATTIFGPNDTTFSNVLGFRCAPTVP
jgi:formylglycine-generating enzyme required for sulfatase activity